MSRGDWITQFDLDNEINLGLFRMAFVQQFEGGEVEFIAEEIMPGHRRLHLHIPIERKEELFPWLEQYAKEHNAEHTQKPAMDFPFNPLC